MDIERFKPALTDDPFVITEGSAVREPIPGDPLHLGLTLNGELNPLVVVGEGDITQRIVSRRASLDLFGSMTVVGPFAVGVGLPVFALQGGEQDPNPAGIGDLRVVPKLRLVDDRRAPIGVAVLAEVRLPTHSDDQFSGGARAVSFAPRLAADRRFGFGLRLGANVGVRLARATTYENVEAGDELLYSAAAAYHFGGYGGRWALGLDAHGAAGLSSLNVEEAPLEGQLYAAVRPRPDLEVKGGPAMGILAGYGTPTLRVFVGVSWSPSPHDSDMDGISDVNDGCPAVAETRNRVDDLDGCPDTSGRYPATVVVRGADRKPLDTVPITIMLADGPSSARSGVPEQLEPGRYPVSIEVPGYENRQAVLIVTPDGDNVLDVRLKALPPPGRVEVTILGPDGQPLKKGAARVDDAPAVADPKTSVVEVEVVPGEHVLWVHAKGYVPQRIEIEVASGATVARTVTLQPIEIEVLDDRLRLSGAVYFDTGSATIVPESFDVLDEVALVLLDNPSIRKMRVEGHTDSRGTEESNQKLSEDRAASVVAYLVSKGVARDRLEAQGFGESRPISDSYDENRRVEFIVVRRGGEEP